MMLGSFMFRSFGTIGLVLAVALVGGCTQNNDSQNQDDQQGAIIHAAEIGLTNKGPATVQGIENNLHNNGWTASVVMLSSNEAQVSFMMGQGLIDRETVMKDTGGNWQPQ